MKTVKVVLCLLLLCGLYIGCEKKSDTAFVKQKLRTSSYYSSKEIEMAMKQVMEQFQINFSGCTLQSIWNDEEHYTLEERKELSKEYNVQQIMMIKTDFQTGFDNVAAGLNENCHYTDYQWILVKDKNNQWSIKDSGYC